MVVITVEGIIVVNLWVETAAEDLPRARVGVNVSAQLSLIKFRSAPMARVLV